MYRGRRPKNDDDSEAQDDDQHLLTDQQKEEELMFKSVFNFYQQNRGGVQIERYELPMLLDGKYLSHELHRPIYPSFSVNLCPSLRVDKSLRLWECI